MAPIIGKNDIFERKYMKEFESIASSYGEFVKYEYDRATRDIGIHFTKVRHDGSEVVSNTLVWFQMKGVMKSTLSKQAYKESTHVSVQIDMNHLKFWYIQPDTTYLVVYVECNNEFLFLNPKKYIEKKWPNNFFELQAKSHKVKVPKRNKVDADFFAEVVRLSDVRIWTEQLKTTKNNMAMCLRDFVIVDRLKEAQTNGRENRMALVDWQSKTRSEVYFQQRSKDDTDKLGTQVRQGFGGVTPGSNSGWYTYVEHWQFMLSVKDINAAFPYLKFECSESDEWEEHFFGNKIESCLQDGTVVRGENYMNEYILYEIQISLNEVGELFYSWLSVLDDFGIIEKSLSEGHSAFISVAPWHFVDA